MPKKRRRRTSSRDLVHGQGIILEEIRSQNRVTIEAIEATRVALEAKIDQVDRNSKARDSVLEAAVRQNSADIKANGTDLRKNSDHTRKNSEDIRVLTVRVEALGPLDHRVSAIERRLAGEA